MRLKVKLARRTVGNMIYREPDLEGYPRLGFRLVRVEGDQAIIDFDNEQVIKYMFERLRKIEEALKKLGAL